jgi:hypothetical protein
MLSQDIERAAATLNAMAAIPCLRGGYVPFDFTNGLEPGGWSDDDVRERNDEVRPQVPDKVDLAECRSRVQAAIDDVSAELEQALEEEVSRDFSLPLQCRLLEGKSRDRRFLECLKVGTAESSTTRAREAQSRWEKVLADLDWDEARREEMRRVVAENAQTVDLIRFLTDDEFRRYVELLTELRIAEEAA